MKFYSIPNWRDFQHYDPTKRTPPWIKTFIAQLDPTKHPKFSALSDGAKLTLHHVRMLAAKCNNRIPESWLNKAHLNMQTKPKIAELLAASLLMDANDASNKESKDASIFPSEGLDSESLVLPEGEREGEPPKNHTKREMSFGQFVYLATQVAKWRVENAHIYDGGDGTGYARAFRKNFSISLKVFEELREKFSAESREIA